MKSIHIVYVVVVIAISACSRSPSDQREDIRESKRVVIEQADALAKDLSREGRSIVQADGSYFGCTIGWSDAGLQYDAYVQLDVVDVRPRDQVLDFADRLERAGWDEVEYVAENPAVSAKSDGVYLTALPSAKATDPGYRSLALTLKAIECLPDPDNAAKNDAFDRRQLPLSVPVEPDKDPDTNRTRPNYYDD